MFFISLGRSFRHTSRKRMNTGIRIYMFGEQQEKPDMVVSVQKKRHGSAAAFDHNGQRMHDKLKFLFTFPSGKSDGRTKGKGKCSDDYSSA